jgi:hypothetical protein
MTSIQIDIKDGLSSSVAIKGPCRVATTANITLAGEQTIDGVAVVTDDRVLVKDQTTVSDNGIYVVDTGNWRRSKDFNKTKDVKKGTLISVTDGATNAGIWQLTTSDPIVVGTTSITFVLVSNAALAGTVPGATGLALLAASAQLAAWTIVSSASAFAQTGTGSFTLDQTPLPRIHKMADRLFLNGAATYNGQFLDANIAGLSADAKALHSWGPRDASLFVDSSVAGLAIVGHSESKNYAGWSAAGTNIPSSAGVAGFAINNRVGGNGQAWGGYFDAVRLTNGFTVGVEVAIANFGSISTINPFNVKTGGADGGVAVWAQIGCGLDAVGYAGAVKDVAAGFVLLSSYADNSAKARSGFVIANGALVDRASGGFVYEAFAMPDRHQVSWYRASDALQTAFIWADVIAGSPVGITFKTGQVEFTGGGTLVNGLTVGLAATGVSPYLTAYGADANVGLKLITKGTGAHEFLTNAATKQFEIAHTATAVNYLQAKGAITTSAPVLSALGTDTNIGFNYATKGAGAFSFFTNSNVKQFEVAHTATAVNYLSATGGTTGAALGAVLSTVGTDANIPLTLQPKGTGSFYVTSSGLLAFQVDGVASGANRMAVISAIAGSGPLLYVAGTDTNISGVLNGKGTGGWQFKDGAGVKKIEYTSTAIGFFNATPVIKQTVGAALSTGGAETNTNIATRINEIRTALINYGLAA